MEEKTAQFKETLNSLCIESDLGGDVCRRNEVEGTGNLLAKKANRMLGLLKRTF